MIDFTICSPQAALIIDYFTAAGIRLSLVFGLNQAQGRLETLGMRGAQQGYGKTFGGVLNEIHFYSKLAEKTPLWIL